MFYCVMLALNLISGPSRSVASAVYRTIKLVKHQTPSEFLKITIDVSFDLPGFCSIVSGAILVYSVTKIRRFFKDRNEEEQIDTRALCIHASCFVSYLCSAILFYTIYNLYTFAPTRAHFLFFQGVNIIYLALNLVSNVLLCQIFWNLGTTKDESKKAVSNFKLMKKQTQTTRFA